MTRRFFYSLGSLFATFLVFSSAIVQQAQTPDTRAWRLSRPLAWRDAAYWSPAFVEAELHVPWNFDKGYALPGDYASPWFNFKDGIRRTTGQPSGMARTIYLLGNSAMYDLAVPDDLTIASRLQTLTPGYRVENYGMASATTAQLLMRLKTIRLRRGDVVVFYGGIADVYAAFVKGRDLGTATYRRALDEARRYAQDRGAAFANVLQPHIWSTALNDYERTFAAYPDVVPPGYEPFVLSAWPRIQAASPGDTLDLTHVLDDARAQGAAFYIDCCHVTERADAMIARAIFDYLFPVI